MSARRDVWCKTAQREKTSVTERRLWYASILNGTRRQVELQRRDARVARATLLRRALKVTVIKPGTIRNDKFANSVFGKGNVCLLHFVDNFPKLESFCWHFNSFFFR